jgi:sulfite exporter TauE/SafE/copper chaperone CopZ
MHCASCERLIETRLRTVPGVTGVRASVATGQVTLSGRGKLPAARTLSALLSDEGYVITETKPAADTNRLGKIARAAGLVLLFLAALLALERLGLAGLITPGDSASLPALFGLGLVAGLSSCAALVGGILLSLCANSRGSHWQAPVTFVGGRLASFTLAGALLGTVGERASLSPTTAAALVLLAVAFMAITGLRNLGWTALGRLLPGPRLGLPIGNGSRSGALGMAVAGALTVFVPCGFTLSAQALAALSGSALAGAGAMLAFALGTAPSLLALGLSATGLARRPQYSRRLTALTGAALVAFALYSANAQLNVLGLPSASDLGTLVATRSQAQAATGPALPRVTVSSSLPTAAPPQDEVGLAPMVEGVQVLQMEAGPYYYTPSHFRLRAGVPARWEITDRGASGCTNAIISPGLFPDRVDLKRGGVVVKEFVPERPGLYKFSCWMGMVAGTIEVIEAS